MAIWIVYIIRRCVPIDPSDDSGWGCVLLKHNESMTSIPFFRTRDNS